MFMEEEGEKEEGRRIHDYSWFQREIRSRNGKLPLPTKSFDILANPSPNSCIYSKRPVGISLVFLK